MGNRADTRPSTQVNPKTSAANLGKDDIDWIVTRLHYKLFGETVSRLLENYNWEASLLQNQWNSSNKSHATDLRPQGPAFNSHAREGVDQELAKVERQRCGANRRWREDDLHDLTGVAIGYRPFGPS
jgi:hypothetical protein